jgi:hypothetical protein
MSFLFAKSFPFCVQESDNQTGDGTDYPFEMTLEDAMELYWKFLSLKVTDNLVYSFINNPTGANCVATHSFSNTIETLSYWPTKMSEMICPPPPYFYGTIGGSNGSMTSTNTVVPTNTTGFYSLSYGGEIITKKINNTYKFYPAFLFEISTDLEYSSNYSTKDNGGLASQIVTLKTSSTEYKTNLYVTGFNPGDHSSISLSGSVVIEKASDRTPE